MQPIELIGAFLFSYSFCTLMVYGLVLTAVFLERKLAAVNAFYTIYMTGCFADTLSLINGFLTYCTLTDFLDADWLNSPVSIKVTQTILWGSRFSQMLTVLMIATNRMTAIRYPLRHSRIWNKVTVRVCSFIQIGSLIVSGGINAFLLQTIRIPSSYGGFVNAMAIDPVYQRTSALISLILQSGNAFLVLAFYIVILRDIRVALRKIPSQYNVAHEGNLHKIALIVCVVEVLQAVYQLVYTQFSPSKETGTIVYIVRTALYNSIPPYLLIIFSKNVRNRLTLMFTVKKRQRRHVVVSMDTVTN